MIYDNRNATLVLGCLLQKPELLIQTDKYQLTTDDFVGRLPTIIFSVIYNLYHNGVEIISIEEIYDYLKNYPELEIVFKEKQGAEVLMLAVESAELSNFDYYYNRVKKMSVLRDLNNQGFDTTIWYEPDTYDIAKRQKMEEKLEDTSVQEIIQYYIGAVSEVESRFVNKENFKFGEAADGVRDLIEGFKEHPEMGIPFQNKILTTVTRGARKAKLYMVSSITGLAKSRLAVANACHSAYPIRYDIKLKEWVNQGSCSRTLFVTTEQEFDEIQTMIIAYLSDVNEEKILNGTFDKNEEERLLVAISIMEYYSENLYISYLPDPNIAQLNSNIRRLAIINKIENLYYDYIHTSPQLLAEFQGLRIREDVALLLIATALKNLTNELSIFIWTSTQVNAKERDIDFANQTVLRGSQAISDKTDFSAVLRKPSRELLQTIEPLLKSSKKIPNLYMDIYKNRRSKYKDVRLWIYADLGTLRFEDLFLTNRYSEQVPVEFLNIIQDIEVPNIETILKGRKKKANIKKETVVPPIIKKSIVEKTAIQITV